MSSTPSHQARPVLPTHPMLHSYAHCASTLLTGLMPGTARSPFDFVARSDAHPPAQHGSSRRKLWELRLDAACPVTGVCLHFHEVQKMARKVGMKVDACPDYELHGLVLRECRRRSPLAELLQRELDRRFALPIQQSQRIKTTEGLAQWWDEACTGADWAGEFWAVLTHPRCSADLVDIVLGQVHMLQHQDGMTARSDATRLNGALAEKHRLTQELAAAQQRLQAQALEHAAAVTSWQAECASLRASVIRAESERDLSQAQSQVLKTTEADKPPRQRLPQDKPHELACHQKLLMRALRREVQMTEPSALRPARGEVPVEDGKRQPTEVTPLTMDLNKRQVLCVGGRTASIPVYRKVIEDRGASFTHHDGGEEDKTARLISQLQAADVVICQVGCISHDAYWRVKEHCKRTDKPCLFIEMSGRSALERALGQKVTFS